MTPDSFSLISFFVVTLVLCALIIGISALVGRKGAPGERYLTYECGVDPVWAPRRRFSVKFVLVGVMFIIFGVEVVFLYPLSLLFRSAVDGGTGPFVILELALFVMAFSLALMYIWGRGALDWEA